MWDVQKKISSVCYVYYINRLRGYPLDKNDDVGICQCPTFAGQTYNISASLEQKGEWDLQVCFRGAFFIFMNYQITQKCYATKPQKGADEWRTLTWNSGDFSRDELMEHLSSNHFYRANFTSTSNWGEKEFISAQVIFLDYDNCKTTMNDYVTNIKVPPSFYYRSHSSDGTGNKFRVGYVLDKPIYSEQEFRVISTAIADNNGGGLTAKDFDPKSFSPYQLWCGSEYEFYQTSYEIPLDKIKQRILKDDPSAFDFKRKSSNNNTITIECRELSQEEQKVKDDFFSLRYPDFISKYMTDPIVCSQPVNENEAFYFYDKNNYFEIIRKYRINEQGRITHYRKNIKNQFEPLRFVDGEHRRSKIAASLSFIHQIEPGIGLGELLAQAVFYINHYIDNTKDSITNWWIWNMVFDEYVSPKNYRSKISRSLKIKKEFFNSNAHYKTKIKGYKKDYCLSMYDHNESIESNLNLINSYLEEETDGVISVSERTLKGYLKEEGILKKGIDDIKQYYKEGLLTMEILDEYKEKINRKSYFRYKSLLKSV